MLQLKTCTPRQEKKISMSATILACAAPEVKPYRGAVAHTAGDPSTCSRVQAAVLLSKYARGIRISPKHCVLAMRIQICATQAFLLG